MLIFICSLEKKDGAEVTLDDEFNVDLDEAERLAAATSTSKSKNDRPAKNYTRDTKVRTCRDIYIVPCSDLFDVKGCQVFIR